MPCLPEIVQLMRTLSTRSSDISVPELADIVQKDPVILAKVLAAANTLGYNPGRVPVVTVTQAIHVIGYERIRSLAMSLLLVEQTSRSHSVDEQRDVISQALTAGCIAQAVCESRGILNPEEASVCASLRSFGRIVMVTCMLDDYRAARQLAAGARDDDAFTRVFGLTPLELGRRLLKASDLPDDITATLRAVTPDSLANPNPSPGDHMLALTDFATHLAGITLQPDLDRNGFTHASQSLARRYHKLIPHLADDTHALVQSASRQLHHFAHTLQIKSLPPRFLSRLRHRAVANPDAPPEEPPAATSTPETPPPAQHAAPSAPTAPELPAPAPFTWSAEIARLTALANSSANPAPPLVDSAFDSLRRGLDATEFLLFSHSALDDAFVLSHRAGRSSHRVDKPSIRASERTVFGICLARGENVLIHRAADPKIRLPTSPPWLPPTDLLGSFALFPILRDNHLHGLLLAGWSTPRQIALSSEETRAIRHLLSLTTGPRTRAAA